MVKSYCVKQKKQTECVSGSEKYVKAKNGRIMLKVPLTPKCFLNRNKTLFSVGYFGENISTIGLFLDFL